MANYDESLILNQLKNPATQRQAFESLVSQYSQMLYWKIRRIVLTHDDANDVLQNTFLKAWMALDDFKGKSKISTWLYRIAVNESLDFLRHNKNVTDTGGDESLAVVKMLTSDPYFDGDEAQVLLQAAIATLPDVQRTVFNLRYFDEMKYSEISQLLGTSEGALKASYHIAVQKITAYIEKESG
ncbi:MAG: RNA polymerase sigma factor [Prevotella sp.]|jgi:RNA polymerase sigma-70 factor (ECF subfamily)|nr:RNA polymerase sigma factor [Prevotella sp.]MBR3445660.1 RNA polymerase sigma factor [Prevotella sp.]MBR7094535.1 RNA polymerase sigma factor [Prevotella sp.]